jgi:signal transduction histidine kinase
MRALSWQNLRRLATAFSNLLRKRERSLAGPPPRALYNEHLVRTGALAARVAHELCSPLTAIAVLIDDLRQQSCANDRLMLAEHLRIMSDQIDACRHIVSRLAAPSEKGSSLPGNGDCAVSIRPLEVVDKEWTRRNDGSVSRRRLHFFFSVRA